MPSKKSLRRDLESAPDSEGDRRTGSVGERPELTGSRDNDNRTGGSKRTEANLDTNPSDPVLDTEG